MRREDVNNLKTKLALAEQELKNKELLLQEKDEAFRKKSEIWVKNLKKDTYLQEAVNIIADMKSKI